LHSATPRVDDAEVTIVTGRLPPFADAHAFLDYRVTFSCAGLRYWPNADGLGHTMIRRLPPPVATSGANALLPFAALTKYDSDSDATPLVA